MDGLKVSAVDVNADLRQLKSDKSMRDERLHTMGIESDTFPTAEFTFGVQSCSLHAPRPAKR
jgi:hypothetical protein